MLCCALSPARPRLVANRLSPSITTTTASPAGGLLHTHTHTYTLFSASHVPCSLPTPPPVTSRSTREHISPRALPLLYLGAARTGRHCFTHLLFPTRHIPAFPCSPHRPGDTPVVLRSNRHTLRLAYITTGLSPTSTLAQPLTVHSDCETCINASARGAANEVTLNCNTRPAQHTTAQWLPMSPHSGTMPCPSATRTTAHELPVLLHAEPTTPTRTRPTMRTEV